MERRIYRDERPKLEGGKLKQFLTKLGNAAFEMPEGYIRDDEYLTDTQGRFKSLAKHAENCKKTAVLQVHDLLRTDYGTGVFGGNMPTKTDVVSVYGYRVLLCAECDTDTLIRYRP